MLLKAAVGKVLDISLPEQLPAMLLQTGYSDVSVDMETDKVLTFTGAIEARSRWNHFTEFTAAMPHFAGPTGGEAAGIALRADWFAYLDHPDTSTILPLWFVRGTVPASVERQVHLDRPGAVAG